MRTLNGTGYDAQYRRIYQMLKGHGHDATKALEIIIAARRRDKFALQWIRVLRVTA